MDRLEELDVARRLDWRFVLPTPRLERAAWVGALDPRVEMAMAASTSEFSHGEVADLPAGAWDVVVVQVDERDGPAARPAFERLVRPGGWILVNLPRRAGSRALLRATIADVTSVGAERVQPLWFLPDRHGARRVTPLDDRNAVRATLSRHGGRPSRRAVALAARGLVRSGIPADALGGEVSLLARRLGGDPVSGWPSIEPLVNDLMTAGRLPAAPSWVLLTPRFPLSAHVVLLLLDGAGARLVAKISRLTGDDGPRHEGRMLDELARAGLPRGAAPRSVLGASVAGHAVLVEEAIDGVPLDRRRVRADPERWIGVAATWLADLPTGARANPDGLIRAPLAALRAARPGDQRIAALVARTEIAVAPLWDDPIPAVFEHGDLSHPNLLVRGDGGLAVLDWERARPDGLPLHDLWFFLGYVALAIGGERSDPFDGLERVLAHPTWGAIDALHAEAARLGVRRVTLPALMVACWARTFAQLAAGPPAASGDPPWLSRYYRLWESAVDRQAQLSPSLV